MPLVNFEKSAMFFWLLSILQCIRKQDDEYLCRYPCRYVWHHENVTNIILFYMGEYLVMGEYGMILYICMGEMGLVIYWGKRWIYMCVCDRLNKFTGQNPGSMLHTDLWHRSLYDNQTVTICKSDNDMTRYLCLALLLGCGPNGGHLL